MATRRRQSQQTPQNRRSALGFGSAASKLKQDQVNKRLTYGSTTKSRNMSSTSSNFTGSSKRWSSQGAHQQFKDTRPLSNRAYQKQMIEDILEFLNSTAYPHQISAKILSAPTTKEFLRVFEHLYLLLDPNFKMEKKFEEEIPRILKSLKYPYTLSKSAMFAIGSLHAWPSLLGALHWLVGNIKIVMDIDIESVLFPPNLIEDNNQEQKKIFLNFDHQVYRRFMEMEDTFSEEREMLDKALLEQAGCSEEDQAFKMDELAELEEELRMLESEPNALEEALQEKAMLDEQIANSDKRIRENEEKEKLYFQQRKMLIQELIEAGVTNIQLGDPTRQEELKRKSADVKQQLDVLNKEKERLDELSHARELRYSQIYDKLSVIMCQYNNIAESFSRRPHIQKHLKGRSILMKFDHNMRDISEVVKMKENLNNLLLEVTNLCREEKTQAERQLIAEKDKFDKLEEMYSEKTDELQKLKNKLRQIEKELLEEEENEGSYEAEIRKLMEERERIDADYNKRVKDLEKAMKALETEDENIQKNMEAYKKEEDEYCDFLEMYNHKVMAYKQKADASLATAKDDIRSFLKELDEETDSIPLCDGD